MLIQVEFDIAFTFAEPTPVLLMTFLHPSRDTDLRGPEAFTVEPYVSVSQYIDSFGNRCGRAVVPAGWVTFRNRAVVEDCGLPDLIVPHAAQCAVEDLPDDTLQFLLPSRYCDVDSDLKDLAWSLFKQTTPGWPRVQAVCDYVHAHIRFDYQLARATRTATEAYREQVGVCRDYMHLAITLCRCLNIPARYCTGYLGYVGIPVLAAPVDFSAWFEVFLDGQWYTFDARNNTPRIGRVLMARGRDAADVAITTIFGEARLEVFQVDTKVI